MKDRIKKDLSKAMALSWLMFKIVCCVALVFVTGPIGVVIVVGYVARKVWKHHRRKFELGKEDKK